MNFVDWNAKAVEERLKEAMETHLKLPAVRGPREFGNAMPETVREKWKDAAPDRTRYITRLSPGAISRMEECWTWMNAVLELGDRLFIDDWMRTKVTKGRKLDEMAERNPSLAKSINRKKTRVCSQIANSLNQKHQVRLNSGDLHMSENQPDLVPTNVSSEKRATHWRATDAKPQIDPSLPDVREFEPRYARAR
jgi:hypothetical protein